jgi:hypothetical protein
MGILLPCLFQDRDIRIRNLPRPYGRILSPYTERFFQTDRSPGVDSENRGRSGLSVNDTYFQDYFDVPV